jgi:CheY-like chemotaxis protein
MDAVSRLAGGIAHDLNNILLVVQGYTEMALVEKDAGAETRAHLAEVRDAAARAAAMVADLLLVGCRSSYLPRLLDMNAVLAPLLSELRTQAGPGIEVRFTPGSDLPSVLADAGQIARVVSVLCARAIEGMPGGGSIVLSTLAAASDRSTAGRVLLRVSDTGPRIADGERAHVFEPYFSRTQGGKGQGLRLSLAHGIVKRFGGEITLEPGRGPGTTFVIALPSHAEAPNVLAAVVPPRQELPAAEPAPAPRAAAAGPTILVADDDEALRTLAVKIISREGFSVLTARDGQEAVDIFEREGHRISLVLLDDVMPRMGGRAALARIRQRSPGLPAILCSGYTWSFDGKEKDAVEPCIILPKPWHARELLLRLREGLGVM